MTGRATYIYGRLVAEDNNNTGFNLSKDVTESDVEGWLNNKDVAKLESQANGQISRLTVTDLEADVNVSNDDLCMCDVIESRGDDPNDFEAAYIIRSNRTFVQYFKRGVGGKQPIAEADVQTELDEHVTEMVNRAVNAELLSRAKSEFGA